MMCAKVLDFSAAFKQIHGRTPEPQPKQGEPSPKQKKPPAGSGKQKTPEPQLDAPAAPETKRGRRVVAEFDLGNPDGERDAFRAVAPGDSVIVKAGGFVAEIVFVGLNHQGLLVCETFKNNEYELPVHYEIDYAANGELPKRVLEGHLADKRHFAVRVERLAFFSPKDGTVANVEIAVIIDGKSTFDMFGLHSD